MYNRLLTNYPITTKSITTGIISSFGDILTQKFIQKKQTIDWRRNFNLFLTGAAFIAPMLHFWYTKGMPFITKRIVSQNSGKFIPAMTGMALDQLGFAPIILTGFFITISFVKDFQMKSISEGFNLAKQKIWDTMIVNWKIWPAATLINLMFVPMAYRVLFANFVGLFWNMYLSYAANN